MKIILSNIGNSLSPPVYPSPMKVQPATNFCSTILFYQKDNISFLLSGGKFTACVFCFHVEGFFNNLLWVWGGILALVYFMMPLCRDCIRLSTRILSFFLVIFICFHLFILEKNMTMQYIWLLSSLHLDLCSCSFLVSSYLSFILLDLPKYKNTLINKLNNWLGRSLLEIGYWTVRKVLMYIFLILHTFWDCILCLVIIKQLFYWNNFGSVVLGLK